MDIKRISPEETKKLLESNSGYIYLDVRTVPEFDTSHVPSGKNVPIMELDEHGVMQLNFRFLEVVEKNFGKDVKCITGCQRGGRSMKAAELLLKAGFTHVQDMRGGFGGETDERGKVTYPGWSLRKLPVSHDCAPEDRYDYLSRK